MLEAGAQAVAAEGRDDVLFVHGHAAALPFPEAQFDLVACRFALHHMESPATAVAEMARVRRQGGAVLTVDMVVADGPLGDRHNDVERMRDPSHASALRESELRAIHEAAGLVIERTALREQEMDGEDWLARSASPDADTDGARAALEAEVGGGEPTGLEPTVQRGRLEIRQRWLLVLAR
jgi:SAM-dependent methyltransferase